MKFIRTTFLTNSRNGLKVSNFIVQIKLQYQITGLFRSIDLSHICL